MGDHNSGTASDGLNELVERLGEFLSNYYHDEIGTLAQRYPGEQSHLTVDWSDLFRFDNDIADDFLDDPDKITKAFQYALEEYDLPDPDLRLTDVSIRMVGLNENELYRPLEITQEKPEGYIGVTGDLARVTEPSPEAETIAYECQRCLTMNDVPQTGDSATEPSECVGCERKGPFEPKRDASVFRDYSKVRVETPPDETGELQREFVDCAVRGDLVWHGHEEHGLLARTGDSVTVYGTVEYEQRTDGRTKKRLFDPYLDIDAIEFDADADDVDIAAHREEFEELADRSDAIDLFAESLVPQLYQTPEWEHALEAMVGYLFAAPRIDIPQGPTYRGDIHMLIVSDYGMGKSMANSAIATYSPNAIKESVTGMSSDVSLLAAAVEDDFGGGGYMLKPGILVRANGGHVILDEIDKTDADLERMNDALEGEQVVDVDKAGKQATFKSRVGLLATGNPVDSRFDPNAPISQQLGIDRSLLSRFDAIVTMQDEADFEQDAAIADTQGRAYLESQEAQFGDREEFDQLDRVVEPEVGRAWIAHARENVTPMIREHHVDEISEWYAEEVRQLNNQYGTDDQMPVPVSARTVMDTIRFAVAFARVHLRDTVTDADVERAKDLSKTLVGQTFDGEKFTPEVSRSNVDMDQDERKDTIPDVLDDEETMTTEEIAEATGLDHETVNGELEQLRANGTIIEESVGEYRKV